jgi:hypothetical protein
MDFTVVSGLIVSLLTLSDFLWWLSALVQVTSNSCWLYPVDLFFSAASSGWTSAMAVHLVVTHIGYKNTGWEYLYYPAVLLFSLGIAGPVGLISGGYSSTGSAG